MSYSNFTANGWLDALVNNTAFSVTQAYVSLHTADPGTTGASEVTGGSYARQSGSFAAAASSSASTNADVDFTSMPAATVTHVGLWDASSAGNFLGGGALSASVTTSSGDTVTITSGNLTASIT